MTIRQDAFQGKPIGVPVIDAHTHIMEDYMGGWYQSYTSNEDVIALMDRLGINCIVTAPHSITSGWMDFTNEAAANAAKEYPGRIYGYISICPHEGIEAVKDTIKKYSKDKAFIGLKFLSGYHGSLTETEYEYALDFAAEVGCPVLCHIWDNNPNMLEVERTVKTRPGLRLMMAHQGGGSAGRTLEYSALMQNYPNLFMEICGSLNNQYSMEEMVELAGEDRVIYGSDLINLDPRFDFGRVVLSTLSEDVKKKILSENFLKIIESSELGHIIL